jgi:hypothetical protein
LIQEVSQTVKTSGGAASFLTAFVSSVKVPPGLTNATQIQIFKQSEKNSEGSFPPAVTVHSSSLFEFCPQGIAFKSQKSNIASILSICPDPTNPEGRPIVDLIEAKFDDIDFEVISKNSLTIDLPRMSSVGLCRFDGEVFLTNTQNNWVYSVDPANPAWSLRKIDLSNFGEIVKGMEVESFKCLRRSGVLAVGFENGYGMLKGGMVYDDERRFIGFHGFGFVGKVEEMTPKDGSEPVVIMTHEFNSVLYYNGFNGLSFVGDFREEKVRTFEDEAVFGNGEDEVKFGVKVVLDNDPNQVELAAE